MARIYAGILGLLAYATVVARGLAYGGPGGELIWSAVWAMFAFAAVGYAIGRTAQWIVDDSVRGRLAAEMQSNATSAAATKLAADTVQTQ
jgi:hypothetical protein